MVQVEGIAISGEQVKGLEDKTFHIKQDPVYVELPDLNNPNETIKKLCITVQLADGAILDYYPNKTSIKMFVAQYGFDMDLWTGHKFVWEVKEEKGFGKDLDVIYVKAEKFNEVLEDVVVKVKK